jgi:outer membrane receptor for monomeric catechols
MKKTSFAALLAAVSTSAMAADAQLEPLIVTASRTAQTADATLAPVTIITREDIERAQAQSVPELLRGLPGIAIASNGGLGKPTSVFLRGTESDHILVLVDGIKSGSATTGSFAWQDIPPEQIERIEIVRGPRSSLYGSKAIGGVIQSWAWDEVKRVYLDDGLELGLDEFLASGQNVHVRTNMQAILLVAAHKDFWQADAATLDALARDFAQAVVEHGLPGSGHTRPASDAGVAGAAAGR